MDAIGGINKNKDGFIAILRLEYLLIIICNISIVKTYKTLLTIAGSVQM